MPVDNTNLGYAGLLGGRSPAFAANQSYGRIQQLENQLAEMQRRYGQMGLRTSNPQQLFAMQSEMQNLERQIEQERQDAQRQAGLQSLQFQQAANRMGSVGGIGRGGKPNQGMLDNSRYIQMLAAMFGGGGSGAGRMW